MERTLIVRRGWLLAAASALLCLPAAAAAQVPVGTPERPVDDVVPQEQDQPRSTSTTRAASAGEELVGTFRLTAGSCTDSGAAGTWFRMMRGGSGVSNNDSPCADDSYNPLDPGTDGGLVTESYQPHPDPAFDGDGNALAARLTRPAPFFGVDFSTATNPVDPQTGTEVVAPRVVHDGGGSLTGDLRAFAAAWNGQDFNQGSPKPDGSTPGDTAAVTGVYDPATRAFTLEWRSQIQGGMFDGFTGVWHLEGVFEPAEAGSASSTVEPDDPDTGSAPPPDPADDSRSADPADTRGQAAADGELANTGPVLPPLLGLVLLALGRGALRARHR